MNTTCSMLRAESAENTGFTLARTLHLVFMELTA